MKNDLLFYIFIMSMILGGAVHLLTDKYIPTNFKPGDCVYFQYTDSNTNYGVKITEIDYINGYYDFYFLDDHLEGRDSIQGMDRVFVKGDCP